MSDQNPFTLIERNQKNIFSRQLDKAINYMRFEKFIYVRAFKALRDASFDFGKLKNYQSIYICGFNRFHNGNGLSNKFKPTASLQNRIKVSTSAFNKNTIGLHLRRTDHMDAINVSSTEKFIQYIEKELKENDNTNFFLATDSAKEEEKLRSLFGHKIISNQSDISRNSVAGIQDALVDLYCLAKTKKIYGSFKSSFSETAAQIGNSELVIVQ